MARTRTLWMPTLAAALVAVLLGTEQAATSAVEPRLTTESIMIPAGAFIPTENSDYFNYGEYLAVASGSSAFTTPLSFPVAIVNIKRITLYAYDNTATASACVWLYRSRPVDGTEDDAGQVCTTDNALRQAVYTTTIDPRRANTALQGPYLWVTVSGPDVKLYGVKINYSYQR